MTKPRDEFDFNTATHSRSVIGPAEGVVVSKLIVMWI